MNDTSAFQLFTFSHLEVLFIFSFHLERAGLENSTRPLVFTSTKGSRASENFEFSSENQILPIYANNFCDAGQVSIF